MGHMGIVLLHVVPAITITLILQLFTHEIGHLIGGIVNGWKLVFIQIFQLVIGRENGKYRIRFVKTVNFQCIMYPAWLNKNSVVYTLGGCMANMVLTIICFICMIAYRTDLIIWLYAWSFFSFGIALLIMNAIPCTKRICNDMACFLLLKNDYYMKLCNNTQLLIAKHLYYGATYKDLGEEVMCLYPECCDNDIYAYQAVLEYYYYLDINDYEKAKKTINKIDTSKNISNSIANIINLEKLYMDILLKMNNREFTPLNKEVYLFRTYQNKEYHTEVFQGDIWDYIRFCEAKGDIHSIRVKIAYEAFEKALSGEYSNALKGIEQTIKGIKIKDYLYAGEYIFFTKQLKYLQGILTSCNTNELMHKSLS